MRWFKAVLDFVSRKRPALTIGFLGTFAVFGTEDVLATGWRIAIAISAWLPYLRHTALEVAQQETLFSTLKARLTDIEPYAIEPDEEDEAPEGSASPWEDDRITGRLDGVRIHVQMRPDGAEAWIDCPALPPDGHMEIGSDNMVLTGDLDFDGSIGLRGDGARWRSLLSADIRAELLAFLRTDGCRVACDRQRLRVRVKVDDPNVFKERLSRAIHLARALGAVHAQPLSTRLWEALRSTSDPAVRARLLQDLAALPDEREAAIEHGRNDPTLKVRLMAATLASPPDAAFIREVIASPDTPRSLLLPAIDALLECAPEDVVFVRETLMAVVSGDDALLQDEARKRLATLGGADVGGLAVVTDTESAAGGLSVMRADHESRARRRSGQGSTE